MRVKVRGFSLLQLLIVVAIIAIIASQGLHGFGNMIKNVELKGAIQSIYFQMQGARSLAVTRQQSIVVDMVTGNQWCMGITDQPDCDCLVANSCTVEGVEKVISYQQYRFALLSGSTFTHNNQSRFAAPRGLAQGYAGALTLTNTVESYKVIVSNTGRVRICALTRPVHPYKMC